MTVAVLPHSEDTFWGGPPQLLTLIILLTSFPWCPTSPPLAPVFVIDVPRVAMCFSVSYFLHFDHFWVSALATIDCMKKLLWWGLSWVNLQIERWEFRTQFDSMYIEQNTNRSLWGWVDGSVVKNTCGSTPTWWLTNIHSSSSRSPTFDFGGHQAYIWCIDMDAGKTTHIYKIN